MSSSPQAVLHNEGVVEDLGDFDVQVLTGRLVVTDRRGGISQGYGADIHIPLQRLPLNQWIRLEDNGGAVLPLLARWDGVRTTVTVDHATAAPQGAQSLYHTKWRFRLTADEQHTHPDGGFSIALYRNPMSGSLDELRVLQSVTQQMHTWSVAGLPVGKTVRLRTPDGAGLPVEVTRRGADVDVTWLPAGRPDSAAAGSATRDPGSSPKGSAAAIIGLAAAAGVAYLMRRRAESKECRPADEPAPQPGPGTAAAPSGRRAGPGAHPVSSPAPPSPEQVKALYRDGIAAERRGDPATAEAKYRRVAQLYRDDLDDGLASVALAASLYQLGGLAIARGDVRSGAADLRRSRKVFLTIARHAGQRGDKEFAEQAKVEAGRIMTMLTDLESAPAPPSRTSSTSRRDQQLQQIRMWDAERARINQSWAQNLGRI